MRKIIYIFILAFVFISNNLRAQEFDDQYLLEELGIADIETEDHIIYQFPEIKTEANLFLGYRFSDVNGPGKAFEYEYLKNYPVLGGELKSFKYPHRLLLDLDANNSKDYFLGMFFMPIQFGDVHYAYKDIVLSRWINTSLFHNVENIELIDLEPASLNYGISIRDGDKQYGVTTGINSLLLRFKTPDYPLHAYIKGFHVYREGEQQQRSQSGSGWFNNIQRITRSRDIEWETKTYTAGVNSHLSYAEVDFFHIEKRFDVKRGEVLFDTYEASAYRPAGIFPHNQFSELKSSSNVIKIHNSYTDRLVTSATFSIKERENEASGATADFFRGAGSLRWMPLPRLSLSMKYLHDELDAENPGTASITDIYGSVTTYSQKVKPSVSKTTDTLSLTGRYRPESRLTLTAKYVYKNIERENADDWNLQDSTGKSAMSLSADMRILRGLKVKTEYARKTIENPSYNTEPDYSDKGLASISWMPSPGINLLVNYSITKEERDDLIFTETQDARDRNTRTDNFLGSGTFQLLTNLSFTASYAFMRYKVEQDIVYDSLGGYPLTDPGVEMNDTAHVYTVSLNYVPFDKLFLLADIS
jgi:hypothetical protein